MFYLNDVYPKKIILNSFYLEKSVGIGKIKYIKVQYFIKFAEK